MRKFLLAAAIFLTILPGPSFAQQTPAPNIGQQISTAISGGATNTQVAGLLQQAPGFNNLSPQQLTSLATGLGGQNASSIINLVNGVASGNLPAAAASAMAAIPGLGTNLNTSSFTSFLQNPSIQSALGSAANLGSAIQTAFNIFQNPSSLLNPGTLASAATAITSAFPSLGTALGGASGVAAALGSAGGLGAATGGTGTGTGTGTGSNAGGGGGSAGTCSSTFSGNSPAGGSCGSCGFIPICQFPPCISRLNGCSGGCIATSLQQRDITTQFISGEFTFHRTWMVDVFFEQHILPALMLFAEQISAAAMGQVVSVGMFLDAKHQLETQRLFQQMMAEAHKDYHPSEGMCTFGTNVRSLAASDRNVDLTAMGISNRVLQRELLSGSSTAGGGQTSDYLSRIAQFRALYCNQSDNGQGLQLLCPNPSRAPGRRNNDINYTAVLESPLTLSLDFTAEGNPDHTTNNPPGTVSADEEDVFALSANLYAHNVAPTIPQAFLSDENGVANPQGVNHYMNIRSIAAKRSVARNSFASIAAMKSQGEAEVQPYLHAIMLEMGVAAEEVPRYLGTRPSYYAQMEILTKKLYQNPSFYTELYDKPANVDRKLVSMQAIDLMQRRDIYRSVLRSEAILAVMLETALGEQQDKVSNEINRMTAEGELVTLPAAP